MALPTLTEMTQAAADAREPRMATLLGINPGGVDPLGLRQINFNLMDLVIPGLNNVARHIRPFTVMSWAWRRAAQCARKEGKAEVLGSELQDFVARVEVIYVWSQLLRDSAADLPGREFLAFLLKADKYTFGGQAWETRREARRDSTALSAAVNYGPALKSLGWVELSDKRGVYKHTELAVKALDALDQVLGDEISHNAFSRLGEVSVTRKDVERWGPLWALDSPSGKEQEAMTLALSGAAASEERRNGSALVVEAVANRNGDCDVKGVRRDMCCAPGDFLPSAPLSQVATYWRAVQGRQLFRLSLESLLHWTMLRLSHRPATIATLAANFVDETENATTLGKWLGAIYAGGMSLPDQMEILQERLSKPSTHDLARAIHAAIAVSLAEVASGPVTEQSDRLPLVKARREAKVYMEKSPLEFMTHVIGSWVLGQHVYWSVARGLGDARGNGKTLLRLKVVPEESGWTLAPGAGANLRNHPNPTPDRLETAISLMKEAGMFQHVPPGEVHGTS